eukprot:TRINITY_DN10771_c0_g1_i1.p2 TRINITY_DN10771_c0_g1~~TRINITY_DN10771_c0_g1_i1.p2  ORF type:complete len:100 (-),score=29.10 TRINITY_DN10771_c0_g1_i1:56-355(-)
MKTVVHALDLVLYAPPNLVLIACTASVALLFNLLLQCTASFVALVTIAAIVLFIASKWIYLAFHQISKMLSRSELVHIRRFRPHASVGSQTLARPSMHR